MSCITVIIYQLWCGGVSGTTWTVITYVYATYFMGNRGYFYGVQKWGCENYIKPAL